MIPLHSINVLNEEETLFCSACVDMWPNSDWEYNKATRTLSFLDKITDKRKNMIKYPDSEYACENWLNWAKDNHWDPTGKPMARIT